MTTPNATLVPDFSEPDAAAVEWERVEQVLRESEMFWLSTLRRDGRPHVTPLPAMWLDGALHFCTGGTEQKARNIEHDARCVLTTGTNTFRVGLDVVAEGEAQRVTDRDLLERLAQLWRDKLDWPFTVRDDVFVDGTNDDNPALVFGVRPVKVLAFGKSPYTQTRFTW